MVNELGAIFNYQKAILSRNLIKKSCFGESKYSYTIRNETKIVPEHIDAPNEEVSDNNPGE